MNRPVHDHTTHKQHIHIKHQNTHIYTIIQQIHNTKHINTYIIFFYLLAVIAVINLIKKKENKRLNK